MTATRSFSGSAVAGDRDRSSFLILADDLTGAADAAVALAGPGRDAEVFLESGPACEALKPGLADAPGRIVAIDLNTRGMPVDAATDSVGRVTAAMSASGFQLFKKIDSTLRGHIGAELAALCRNLPPAGAAPALCIVAPAHPDLGRTIEDGQLRIHGAAATSTALWGDSAVSHCASITAELQAHGFACTPLPLSAVRSLNMHELSGVIERAASSAFPALVCDAQSMDDMRRIAAAALDARAGCVWVGSGGLAQALADVLEPAADNATPGPLTAAPKGSRAFVVGSFSSVAREQVRQLVQTGHVARVALTMEELTGHPTSENARRIDDILAAGQDLVLCIDAGQAVRPELSDALARGMAEIVAVRLERLAALVCCGGDTSRALLNRIRVGHLRVRRSAEAGATHAYTELQPQLPLVMKAGAFGDAQLLVRLRQQLIAPPPPLP